MGSYLCILEIKTGLFETIVVLSLSSRKFYFRLYSYIGIIIIIIFLRL